MISLAFELHFRDSFHILRIVIVDAHTHYFPPNVARDPKAFAQEYNEGIDLALVLPNGKPGIQGWATKEGMLEEMDKASVDQVVVLGWYWENPVTCRLQNDWSRQLIEEYPDRFIAFAHPTPRLEKPHRRSEKISGTRFSRDRRMPPGSPGNRS